MFMGWRNDFETGSSGAEDIEQDEHNRLSLITSKVLSNKAPVDTTWQHLLGGGDAQIRRGFTASQFRWLELK